MILARAVAGIGCLDRLGYGTFWPVVTAECDVQIDMLHFRNVPRGFRPLEDAEGRGLSFRVLAFGVQIFIVDSGTTAVVRGLRNPIVAP
jgi:hypothetical protein